MKKTRNKCEDSEDDIDDMPLKYISSNHKIYSSIKELKAPSVHACEFCEEKFENMYSYLIHNSKHIIIPLIKMLPHYCADCKLYYLSEEEMNDHILTTHKPQVTPKNSNVAPKKAKERITFEMDDNEDVTNENIPLSKIKEESIDEKQKSNTTSKILESFMMNCKVDIEKFDTLWITQHKAEVHKNDHINGNESNLVKSLESVAGTSVGDSNKEENTAKHLLEVYKTSKLHDLSNKVDSNKHIAELKHHNNIDNYKGELKSHHTPLNINEVKDIKNCTVKFESSTKLNEVVNGCMDNSQHNVDLEQDTTDIYDDPIFILPPIKQERVTDYSSIHFDDLMKPGIFFCKRCFQRYPNRYDVIKHELIHLDLAKAYIKKGRKRHKNLQAVVKESSVTSHMDIVESDDNQKQIEKDREEDRVTKRTDLKSNSDLYSNSCTKSFRNATDLKIHKTVCNSEATVYLCDLCLYLRKRPKLMKYIEITRLGKITKQCHWCGKSDEVMSLVTIMTTSKADVKKLVDGIKFENNLGNDVKRLADRIEFENTKGVKDDNDSIVFVKGNKRGGRVTIWGKGRSKKCTESDVKATFEAPEKAPGRITKPLSNIERLKVIQNRLKMLKK